MPPRKISLSKTFLLFPALVGLISIFTVGCLWVVSEIAVFKKETTELRVSYLEAKKSQIKREVDRAMDFVHYMQGEVETRLRGSIRNRVYEAHSVAENLYTTHTDTESIETINHMIKEALRPIRFNNGRGYYFAFNLNGVETLFAVRPELEGKNMLKMTGGKGKTVVADMIDLVKKDGEGFYRYHWTKPGQKGQFPKIAFVKLFKPTGWVIGTGEYIDDVERDIQNECIDWISKIRFGNNGYVFAGRWNGLSLSGPQAGKNMYDIEDVNGVPIVQNLIEAAREGGGFVRYVLPGFEGKKHAPKISYAAPVPEWKWYIGAGLYIGEIEKEIEAKQSALYQRIRRNILNAIVILLTILTVTALAVKFISSRIRSNLELFTRFFRRAASDTVKIERDKLYFDEFDRLAESANDMVEYQQKMEQHLRQSQKIESIGNLAGGIAHDFNNILAPIVGMSEMLLEDLPEESIEHENVKEIFKAGKRGRDLVKQILSFSRRSEQEKMPVRIQSILKEALKLTRSTIPANIDIQRNIREDCGMVMADPTRLHQVIMNLLTNANLALEGSDGKITVTLKEVYSDGGLQTDSPPSGKYALLEVADTGTGIDPSVIDKIFDPYFTTREQGKGSGLGLAVVHGIVKESGGDIRVDSEKGKGSVFRVFWPLLENPVETKEKPTQSSLAQGTEHIFLVDDEQSIVKFEKQFLERLGYQVTWKTDSIEALHTVKASPEQFDLLVTDMSMPGMTGEQLAKEVMRINSHMPVIICTGFSKTIDREKARNLGIKGLLLKPVVMEDLANLVRNVLDDKHR